MRREVSLSTEVESTVCFGGIMAAWRKRDYLSLDTSGTIIGGAMHTAIALNQIGQTTSWLGVELGRAGMAAAALRPAFAIQPACRTSPFPVLLACLYRFCSFLHSPVDSSCALLSDTHTQTQCQNVEPASSSNLARSVLLRLTCFAPPL
jgi:uncharacterized membrane protein (UPF0136 family)